MGGWISGRLGAAKAVASHRTPNFRVGLRCRVVVFAVIGFSAIETSIKNDSEGDGNEWGQRFPGRF
jgi:hypothetical protein